MKVASWNVNSLRVRLEHVVEWLDAEKPDVLGLQEIKMPTDAFPEEAFREIGYQWAVDGQKTYNGVALLSKTEGKDIHKAIPDLEDEQKRAIAGTYEGTRVINLYVPNGQSVGSDKYAYKLKWLTALDAWLQSELKKHERLIVMGDFNIAPDDRDVHDPAEWEGKVLCSDAERAALQRLVDMGLQDSFRLFDQPENSFSWWDYRAAGFRRNRGMRIDLLLVSAAVAESCVQSRIDIEPRTLERPSDHAPVWIEF